MAIVWEPDNRILPDSRAQGAWQLDTGPLRAALAGWRTGVPTVAVWGPRGARVTYQLHRLVWVMQDGSRVPIASTGPAEATTDAPNRLRVGRAVGGVEDIWEAQGDRLKHSWRVPKLEVPVGAAALAMEGSLSMTALSLASDEGRSAGSIGLFHPAQAEPLMQIARGDAVDELEGARTHVTYEWRPAPDGKRSTVLTTLVDAEWIRSLQGGFTVDPTISTSTSSAATAYPNQRKEDRFSNGVLFGLFYDGTNLVCRYSADNGATWQTPTAGATVATGQTLNGSVHIVGDYLHLVYSSASTGQVWFVRGTPNAGRTGYTWSSALQVSGSSSDQTPDVVAHGEGSGWKAHVVWSQTGDTQGIVLWCPIDITSGGTVTKGTSMPVYVGAVAYTHTYPSIAIDGTKKLHCAYTTGTTSTGKGVRYRVAPYSSGSWTWGAEEAVTESYYAAAGYMGPCAVDQLGRVYVLFTDAQTNYNRLRVYRRSVAGGWTLITPTTSEWEFSWAGSLSVHTDDNPYIGYTRNSNLNWRKFDGTNWTAATVVEAANYVTMRRDTSGSAVDFLSTQDAGGSNYSVRHNRLTLNVAPLEPSITVTPASFAASSGTQVDVTHHDADQMGGCALKFVDGSNLYWWRASDKSLQTTEVINPASGYLYTILAADLAGKLTTGRSYQVYAATVDSQGLMGPYNSVAVIANAGSKPQPTISSGSTSNSASYTATWTVDVGQGAYQVRVLNGATEISTTGKTISTSARARTVTLAQNGVAYTVELTVWDQAGGDGIASEPVSKTVTTSYTPPDDVESMTATPLPGRASIRVTWAPGSNPTGTESGTYHISRRRAEEADSAYRVLASGWSETTYEDHTAASGQQYVYRILAIGTNGVLSDGTTLLLTGAETEG